MILTDEQLDNNCINILNSFIQLYPETYAALLMMYRFGLRWIEVFEIIRWTQPTFEEYEVDTAKNSKNRIIPVRDVPPGFRTLIASDRDFIMQFGYMSMRRYFKKYSYYADLAVGHKPLSLHSFRYNRARIMKAEGSTDENIKLWFGEVEQSNMNRYIYSIITA